MSEIKKYKTVWISDIHLGTRSCKSELLLSFLKNISTEKLYLVGDIADGWVLKQRWYWPQEHNDVVRRLLKMAKNTEVIYIPGNHDEFIRGYCPLSFGDVKIRTYDIHTTANGKRLVVLHGDIFDGFVTKSKIVAQLGSVLYDFIVQLNDLHHSINKKIGNDYWSLSEFIKSKTKEAIRATERFENAAFEYARLKGYDGIVCGHLHYATIKDTNGIVYVNDGDWVETCSAAVETADGTLEIVRLT